MNPKATGGGSGGASSFLDRLDASKEKSEETYLEPQQHRFLKYKKEDDDATHAGKAVHW